MTGDVSESLGQFDVAIIGAGMIGASTGYHLAERGYRVALIDADHIGRGTSNNSFAWINATSKTSNEDYHRLNALGAAGYRTLANQWGEERIGLHPTGMIQWAAPDDTAEIGAIDARLAQLTAWGYPVSALDYDELCALEPHVVFPVGARGLHAIADGWLDTPTFIRFAAERIEAAGGRIFDHAAVGALALDDDGKITGLATSKGDIQTQKVMVAAGQGTPEALEALTEYEPYRTRFPMQRAPGLLVRTPPQTPWRFARRILYAFTQNAVHIRPTPDGGLLLGADDTDGSATTPEDRAGLRAAATTLLERAAELIPKFPGAPLLDQCEIKIGVRPMPLDGHSIAGPLPGADGLFLGLTHSGVTIAPALGRLMADTIETGRAPPTLSPFGFERFQSV